MSLIAINWRPNRRDLRSFAWVWLIGFALFGLLTAWRSGAFSGSTPFGWIGPWRLPLTLWAAAVVVWAAGVAYPPAVKPVYLGWTGLTYPIGWTVSHALLLVTYYGVFTASAIGLRLTGRDLLDQRLDRSASTYWTPHDQVTDPRRYFKQF